MQLAFSFDQTRCTGCHTCVVSCKDWHDVPAGPVGFRRVETREEGRFPNVKVFHLSISCNHCKKPPCADACPEDAIIKREDDGIVLIDREKCTGCRICESACPYDAISFLAQEDTVARKCDFCTDRLENGEPPVCVAACPMRALDFGDFEQLLRRPDVATHVAHLPEGKDVGPALAVRAK